MSDKNILVQATHVKKWFPIKKWFFEKQNYVKAVDDVSLTLYRGETLGIVGESGCGKSTLARTLLRLIEPTDGDIIYDGKDLIAMKGNELRWLNEGAVPNMMDNLIADGKAEPFVIVTMNNQDLGFENYDKLWAEQELIMAYAEENYNIADYADTLLPEGIEHVHPRFAISWRNRWMLDHADIVVTYITHSWGGAAQFVELAERQGKVLIRLAE